MGVGIYSKPTTLLLLLDSLVPMSTGAPLQGTPPHHFHHAPCLAPLPSTSLACVAAGCRVTTAAIVTITRLPYVAIRAIFYQPHTFSPCFLLYNSFFSCILLSLWGGHTGMFITRIGAALFTFNGTHHNAPPIHSRG